MTDHADKPGLEQTISDLDVLAEQAEGVKGGVTVDVARAPGPVFVPTPYPNGGLPEPRRHSE